MSKISVATPIDHWDINYPIIAQVDRLAKYFLHIEQEATSRAVYRIKKKRLIFAAVVCGVEFELADDIVSMLAVGALDRRFHLVRVRDVGYPSYQQEYCDAIESLKRLCSLIEAAFATAENFAHAFGAIGRLPFDETSLVRKRLCNALDAFKANQKHAALFEVKHALGNLQRLVRNFERAKPTLKQRCKLRESLGDARDECKSTKTLRSETLIQIWQQIDLWPFTTERLLRDWHWLQNAGQAARVEGNFAKANLELLRIQEDLCGGGRGHHPTKPKVGPDRSGPSQSLLFQWIPEFGLMFKVQARNRLRETIVLG